MAAQLRVHPSRPGRSGSPAGRTTTTEQTGRPSNQRPRRANLAVVVGGYVAAHGYSFAEAFEFGLEVILEGKRHELSAGRSAGTSPVLRGDSGMPVST